MKTQPKFVAIAILVSSLFTPVDAQEKAWTLGSRTLPAPTAASDALRASIADTPQPNVAEHIRTTTFTTKEEWVRTIRALNASNMQSGEALKERRSVTIKKAEIAAVTVRTVTPADINPANENRLFVHVHGGAYVLNAGRAGLSEAILIAHRVKIPVMSIDYRMPPEHPFPAAIDDVVAVWRSLLDDDRPAKSMAL
ncbi:MAG: alpha/beta hydrolase fold domain-containing protein, partial [Gammaproteobacteria bacterium]|nr:alpha/beta hydrolase fold domain-containing protein [Gammaproteobacteria bacterium]